MKNVILLFILIISLPILVGCLNQYEKPLIGNYIVSEFELQDSSDKIKHNLPTLSLKSDKTFSLEFSNSKVEGKWEGGDNGDWTYIDFYLDGKKVEGIVGVNQITIPNPWQFDWTSFKKMTFEKNK